MQHKTLNELKSVAEIEPGHVAMTREQKLQRWADLLERVPDRVLATLSGTEYQPIRKREAMRSTDSPLSVALEDPVLRAEGLKDDTYGEAKRFFEITDWQLHEIVCYCHFGASMTAGTAAQHVRAAIDRSSRTGVLSRLRGALIW